MWVGILTLILFCLTIVLYRIQLNKLLRVYYDTCNKLESEYKRSEASLQALIDDLDVRVKILEGNNPEED